MSRQMHPGLPGGDASAQMMMQAAGGVPPPQVGAGVGIQMRGGAMHQGAMGMDPPGGLGGKPKPYDDAPPEHVQAMAGSYHAAADDEANKAAGGVPQLGGGMLGAQEATPQANARLLQLLAQKVDEIAGQIHDVHQCLIRSYQNTTDYIRDQHEITRFRALGAALPHPAGQPVPQPPPIHAAAGSAKKRSTKIKAERTKEMKKNISTKLDKTLLKAFKDELRPDFLTDQVGSHREKARRGIEAIAKRHPKEFEDFVDLVTGAYDYTRRDVIWVLEEKGINLIKNSRTRKKKGGPGGGDGDDDEDDDDDEGDSRRSESRRAVGGDPSGQVAGAAAIAGRVGQPGVGDGGAGVGAADDGGAGQALNAVSVLGTHGLQGEEDDNPRPAKRPKEQ